MSAYMDWLERLDEDQLLEERAIQEQIEQDLHWSNLMWFLTHEYGKLTLPGYNLKPVRRVA